MAFRYQKRTYQNAKDRINSSGGYDTYIKSKFKMYKVKDGKNLVRILPPTWDDANHYGYSIYLNYGIGPDNATYLSLSKMLGKPDPLAEARAEANRAGNEELTKSLEARERVLIWVIDRDAEEEGPQVWACPKTVDTDVLSLSVDDDVQDLIAIDHPTKGQDLRFYREGKGLNTKYPAAKMRLIKPSPVSEDQELQDKWLGFIEANPLPTCLNFYDYKHISNVYNGPSDDDDEPPKKAKKAAEPEDEEPEEKPKARAKREEPEDEPEPEEKPRRLAKPKAEEPEDEPEEKPKARTRARLKDPEPEDDAPEDEPEPDDDPPEDDPEEKPAKKAKKGDDEELSIKERLRKRRQAADDDDE